MAIGLDMKCGSQYPHCLQLCTSSIEHSGMFLRCCVRHLNCCLHSVTWVQFLCAFGPSGGHAVRAAPGLKAAVIWPCLAAPKRHSFGAERPWPALGHVAAHQCAWLGAVAPCQYAGVGRTNCSNIACSLSRLAQHKLCLKQNSCHDGAQRLKLYARQPIYLGLLSRVWSPAWA